MTELQIPENIINDVLEKAKAAVPLESCGILAGNGNLVKKNYNMANLDKSRVHFTMDPAEQFAVIKDMRAADLEMLVIYHSHPETPARLSEEDIRLAITPDVIYVIISLLDADNILVKGFTVENNRAIEVPIKIIEESNE